MALDTHTQMEGLTRANSILLNVTRSIESVAGVVLERITHCEGIWPTTYPTVQAVVT